MAPFTLAGFFHPGIIFGTSVYFALGVIGTFLVPFLFAKETPNISKADAVKLALTLNWTAVVCLYVFWLWVYMHQLNPLIAPIHDNK